MNTSVRTYFEHIVAIANAAVQDQTQPPQKAPPVFDSLQEARATAWSALAVHPMSVLESEYVGVVKAAEKSAGDDKELARERGFTALSSFFTLASEKPVLLNPDAPALVDERSASITARFKLVRTMHEEGSPDTYNELKAVIADAADLVDAMTDTKELPNTQDGLQTAASYLGMFTTAASNVAANWAISHSDQTKVAEYCDEVQTCLLAPLLTAENSAASPRSLYNIEPFYLYRLMHRFVGGDQQTPMGLTAKGTASGAATAAMHPASWHWLSEWHEEQIVKLKNLLSALNTKLKSSAPAADDVIRFHLKGGRAMNTALGTPGEGTNDWDTGILINPALPPKDWYAAFAAVNDIVVAFLDKARFSYTALLNANDLTMGKSATAGASLNNKANHKPLRLYSRMALLAEHDVEQHGRSNTSGSSVASSTQVATTVAAGPWCRSRTSAINGELIDIGIAKRNSVELAEYWLDLKIVDRPGSTGTPPNAIPVPTLPYFVDDFSTIIREALTIGNVDRKLAKRLRRLKKVLESDDAILLAAVADAHATAESTLPKGSKAFGIGTTNSTERLKSWVLAGLIRSMPEVLTAPSSTSSLDDYLTTHAAALLNPKETSQFWDKIKGSIDQADQADCQTLLCVQNAASTLARQVVADASLLAQAIDVSSQSGLARAISAVMALNTPAASNGFFYLTGAVAARMQASHAGLDIGNIIPVCPDAMIEIHFRPGNLNPTIDLKLLCSHLNVQHELTAAIQSQANSESIVISRKQPIPNIQILNPTPAMMRICIEPLGAGSARILDYINTWPVASARDLTRFFADRAAHSPDFDLRQGRRETATFLRTDVLGRQLQ